MMTPALNGTSFVGLRLHTSLKTHESQSLQYAADPSRPAAYPSEYPEREVERGRKSEHGHWQTHQRSASLESTSSMSSAGESLGPESEGEAEEVEVEDTPMPAYAMSKMLLAALYHVREVIPLPASQTVPSPPKPCLPLPPPVEAVAQPKARRPVASVPENVRLSVPSSLGPNPDRRRTPKSLSRPPARSSSWSWPSSPPSHPPKPTPLPTIEVQFQIARQALLFSFDKFKQLFNHELDTPRLHEIFDNPIPEQIAEAEFLPQPTIATHRMYWQGEAARVPEALVTALNTSLTRLVVTNCKLALDDVIAMLVLVESLETLEVREVAQDDPAAAPSFLHTTLADRRSLQARLHGLKSLTLKSRVPLDAFFRHFYFKRLDLLSLRLHDEANYTDFDFLSPTAGRRQGIRSVRLRGTFPPSELETLRGWLEDSGISFDVERMPPAHGDKILPSRSVPM